MSGLWKDVRSELFSYMKKCLDKENIKMDNTEIRAQVKKMCDVLFKYKERKESIDISQAVGVCCHKGSIC